MVSLWIAVLMVIGHSASAIESDILKLKNFNAAVEGLLSGLNNFTDEINCVIKNGLPSARQSQFKEKVAILNEEIAFSLGTIANLTDIIKKNDAEKGSLEEENVLIDVVEIVFEYLEGLTKEFVQLLSNQPNVDDKNLVKCGGQTAPNSTKTGQNNIIFNIVEQLNNQVQIAAGKLKESAKNNDQKGIQLFKGIGHLFEKVFNVLLPRATRDSNYIRATIVSLRKHLQESLQNVYTMGEGLKNLAGSIKEELKKQLNVLQDELREQFSDLLAAIRQMIRGDSEN